MRILFVADYKRGWHEINDEAKNHLVNYGTLPASYTHEGKRFRKITIMFNTVDTVVYADADWDDATAWRKLSLGYGASDK